MRACWEEQGIKSPARSLLRRVAVEAAEVVLAADVVGVRTGVSGSRSGRGGESGVGRRLAALLQLGRLLHVGDDVDVAAAAALVGDRRVDRRVDGDLRRAQLLRRRLSVRALRRQRERMPCVRT